MRFASLGSETYRDRSAAGAVLADQLTEYRQQPDAIVLGLVRGGVPVAAEVTRRLELPLDVLVVRKLGVPWVPEVAFGALGPKGVRVLNTAIAARLDPADIDEVTEREAREVTRREAAYRGRRPPLDLTGRTAIVVDDGLATGATARAAITVARRMGANKVVVAVPVGAVEAVNWLSEEADQVVCPLTPADFGAVSRFYDDFHQVSDAEVRTLLDAASGAES